MLDLIRENGLYLLIGGYPNEELGGLALTLLISAVCMVIVMPLAVIVALARTSGRQILSRAAALYVNFMRTIPLLLIVFWVYFFSPSVIGHALSGFSTIVVAIVIYQTAFLSEVIRAGILAIPRGQFEAAKALGLSPYATTVKVILPQVLFNVSPGILNILTIIVKETSLGYMVGLSELSLSASHVNSLTLSKPLELFAILAIMYFVICYGLGRVVRLLEARIERRRRYAL